MENLLSIGDCIGVAARHCRRDIKFLVGKLLVPSIIEVIGKVFLAVGLQAIAAGMRGNSLGNVPLDAVLWMLLGAVISIPAEVWMTMRQLGYVRMLVNGTNDYDAAYKAVRPKFWSVVFYATGFYLAFFIWVFVWAFLLGVVSVIVSKLAPLLLPLVVLTLVAMAVAVFVAIFVPLPLLFVVLACDDHKFWGTLARAYKMTYSNFFRALGFAVGVCICWTALYMALSLLLQILYLWHGGTNMQNPVPIYAQALGTAWISVISMYLMPLYFVASGYFYYSLRMRKEGLDITYKLDLIEKKRDALAG